MRRHQKRCPFCKEIFTPMYEDQKYCKPQHRKNHNARQARAAKKQEAEPASRQCRYCSLPFVPIRPNQTFCSRAHNKAFWQHGTLPFEKLVLKIDRDLVAPLRARLDALEKSQGIAAAVAVEREHTRDVLNAGGGAAA